jgi:hypothetical protein
MTYLNGSSTVDQELDVGCSRIVDHHRQVHVFERNLPLRLEHDATFFVTYNASPEQRLRIDNSRIFPAKLSHQEQHNTA